MNILDERHPFYRPLWRRVAIVAVAFAWAGFELYMGAGVWALVFAAIGAFAGWNLLVAYPGARAEKDEERGNG